MPGIFSYAAATHPAIVTGPAAQAPAHNLSLAGEVGQVASRGGLQAFGRIFS